MATQIMITWSSGIPACWRTTGDCMMPWLLITAPSPRDQAALTRAVATAPQSNGVSSLPPRPRHARHHPLGVAGADPIERFTGDDKEIPGLGVHRRRRAYRQTDDFLNQRSGHWIGFVTADAPATKN